MATAGEKGREGRGGEGGGREGGGREGGGRERGEGEGKGGSGERRMEGWGRGEWSRPHSTVLVRRMPLNNVEHKVLSVPDAEQFCSVVALTTKGGKPVTTTTADGLGEHNT